MPVKTCIYTTGRYLEYHSVYPLVWIGTPPPPLPVSVFPPLNQRRGEHTRLRVRGWGSLNSDYWRKSLALCLYFAGESLAALSTLGCRGHIYLCDTITVYPVPNQTVCTSIYIAYYSVYMWNMYNRMKPPYFRLNIRLLFSDLFRIRIQNPDPKQDPKCLFRFRIGSGSGSGQKFRILPDPVPAPDPQHWIFSLLRLVSMHVVTEENIFGIFLKCCSFLFKG